MDDNSLAHPFLPIFESWKKRPTVAACLPALESLTSTVNPPFLCDKISFAYVIFPLHTSHYKIFMIPEPPFILSLPNVVPMFSQDLGEFLPSQYPVPNLALFQKAVVPAGV